MTRFARATGSKASNERIPNEPTPWHVMKDQISSDNFHKASSSQEKAKSAKQLLSEKEAPYYSESLGNVNNDWAEFEETKTKVDASKKQDANSHRVKKDKVEKSETTLEAVNKSSESKEITANEGKKKRKAEEMTDTESTKPSTETEKKKQRKRKKKKVEVNTEVKTENTEVDKHPKGTVKLSKRQKRNINNQKKKLANAEGSEDQKPAGSNVSGPDNKNEKEQNPKRSGKFAGENGRNEGPNFNSFNKPEQHKKPGKIRDDKEHKRRKPDEGAMVMIINGEKVDVVKYDGFPVAKDDAERLKELRKNMLLKGIPRKDVDAAMKLERRKAEKALVRLRKHVCFHCRKSGHNLSDCPELDKEENGTGICFKCGSTEHTHFECKVTKTEDYRFARCFICREQGHVAKQCPDNPKGMYPQGGACKTCGDVTHLVKDCPDLVKQKEETAITVNTISGANLESLDDELKMKAKPVQKKKENIVKF